ncbi:MAG: SIS domain-containing protein [Anaerolineae bacterium]|nr:SIS domain-containing protein [Anaerolineae bacterium]MCA9911041.1 SIS domain-containing protein [Anaerolineae bacterium]
MKAIQAKLKEIEETQTGAIDQAAQIVFEALRADKMIYLFGTGHSHMLAEEGHYRAGGLAAVCPILQGGLMLHEGALLSTKLERTSGLAEEVLSRYLTEAGDVLFVYSNSGVNAVPVEMALAAKSRDMTVIAVVALDYAATVAPGPTGKKLADIADLVIDNRGVPGDALIPINSDGVKSGPLSTIGGALILNAILTEACLRLEQSGKPAPVYVSANMPNAQARNAELIARYRRRNPHL